MADVAKHANATSCWTAIRGSVYNLTTWIGSHPGGKEAILSICGKDGTAAFVDQHGGSGQQESILATFKIGTLAQ
jgi:cytochrome b involved in lipid metabolism